MAAREAGRVAVAYGLVAALWIFASDRAVASLRVSPEVASWLQTYKGFLFVTVTALGLYAALRHRVGLLEEARRKERAHAEALERAYEATLEGWARALALKEGRTEEHSRRVAELTVRIAQAMGTGPDQLVHVRRGALLHDVGKIGVPDHILLKPGPLSEEEWAVMRKHPSLARHLLEPVEYLRPAMAIPYYQHERWDGSGYPEGLRGEQIPLEARIFAVVDVYDALTSDRPYRRAWTHEQVLAYLRDQAGLQFDPRVVEVALPLLEEACRKPAACS